MIVQSTGRFALWDNGSPRTDDGDSDELNPASPSSSDVSLSKDEKIL